MKTIEYYLEDTLNQLVEEALAVKENADSDSDSEFKKGILFGYYEVISKFLNQAEAFNITHKLPKKIREFNPESLLKY